MKKARSKTGFFVLGISFSAFGAEAQDARQKGLRLPEGGFIGRKGLRAGELYDQPAVHPGLTEGQERLRHIEGVARI